MLLNIVSTSERDGCSKKIKIKNIERNERYCILTYLTVIYTRCVSNFRIRRAHENRAVNFTTLVSLVSCTRETTLSLSRPR